jgi:16S rRNA (cytidine1402-2'-O)-methyltransferase
MHIDQNLNILKPGLYCVATPIGNLGDITLRALEIIKNSDLILCEDTRVSKKLFNRYKISKKLVSNHKFNEKKNLSLVLELLEKNKIISIVSDAGTPTISDPGKLLINKCIEKNINIFSVPGPSAVSAAVAVSGFSDKYLFCGFLPEKKTELNKLFSSISNINYSIVFFISPKKISKITDLIKKYFFNRNILICREITKFHEEYIRSSIKNLSEISLSSKGEMTVIISEDNNLKKNFNKLEESDKKKIGKLIKKMTIKNIIKEINKDNKFPKKLIYDYCLKIKNENK